MGFIYKVTNQINGKVYIGKTEYANPLDRWKEHCQDYKKRRCEKRPFYYAMNKYGPENFAFTVIDEVDDSDKLCELEMYYIDKYRSYVGFKECNGYNATLGGDGKAYLSLDEDEVITVHIENGYVTKYTAKYFGCSRKAIKNILKKHNVKWLSDEEIARRNFYETYGGLVQLSFDCTYIVDIYESPKIVCSLNPDFIYNSLRMSYLPSRKTHHYKGYTWYRLSELPEEYKPLLQEYYINEDNLPIDFTML